MDILKSIQGQRGTRTDKEGSPYFDDYPASIAAATKEHYDIGQYAAFADARKYLPLDYIQLINNDSVALELSIKGQRHYTPPGAIITISDESFMDFAIKNMDAAVATTANKIHIVLQRQALNEDKALRRKL